MRADDLATAEVTLTMIRSLESQEIVTVFEKFPRIAFICVLHGMNLSDNKRDYEHHNGRR
jgi:hypothetical protein